MSDPITGRTFKRGPVYYGIKEHHREATYTDIKQKLNDITKREAGIWRGKDGAKSNAQDNIEVMKREVENVHGDDERATQPKRQKVMPERKSTDLEDDDPAIKAE